MLLGAKLDGDYKISGWLIKQYDQLESTNQTMMQEFKNNEFLHHFVITAEEQTKGRGRLGNKWASPKGNSYSTYILNVQKAPFFQQDQNFSFLGFATAIAIVQSLLDLGVKKEQILCKWPNDILIEGQKISGVLLESITNSNNQLQAIMVGCGVNLHAAPQNTEQKVCILQTLIGREVSPEEYLQHYLHNLRYVLEHWQSEGRAWLLDIWRQYSHQQGDRIRVRLHNETFYGAFEHLDAQGRLVVRQDDDRLRVIYAGDVFLL